MAAISIQQCAEQSAAERRERRKQKVLENAEKRLNVLLGVDGDKRVAPAMDGFSGAAAAAAQNVPVASPSQANASHASCKSPCSKSDTLELLNNTQEDEDRITYVTPKYVDYIDRTRFWIAVLLGCVLGVVSIFTSSIGSVFLPTIILITTYECIAFRNKKNLYPMHGYIVNAILALGLNEDLVANIGLLLDALWEMMIDLLLVSTSFLTVRILSTPLLTQ